MHLTNAAMFAVCGTASASLFTSPNSFDFSLLTKRASAKCPTYWQFISKDLNTAFLTTDGQCNAMARAAIRYAFHDAGTYSSKLAFSGPAGGGADGSLLLNPTEIGRGDNGGLEDYNAFIQGKLTSYRNSYGAVGAADLIQFASNVAIVTCPGGPKVKTVVGRTDSNVASPAGIMPPGFGPGSDHDSLLQLFLDKGFDAKELAALVGAHTCSTAFKQSPNIPVDGAQDSTPGKWDVNFYAETYSPPANVYRFDSDKNLANKTTTVGKQFSGFVGSQGKWASAFAAAMYKLSVLGIPSGTSKDFAECTSYLPAGTAVKMIRSAPISDRYH